MSLPPRTAPSASGWSDSLPGGTFTRRECAPLQGAHNNISEAGFVGVGQGRRNYVGCRTERGMFVATTFYTIVESARVCGANEDAYLRYAAETQLAGGDALLPHEWLAAAANPN